MHVSRGTTVKATMMSKIKTSRIGNSHPLPYKCWQAAQEGEGNGFSTRKLIAKEKLCYSTSSLTDAPKLAIKFAILFDKATLYANTALQPSIPP